MVITIEGWSFSGPYKESGLRDASGVYVVLDHRRTGYEDKYFYIDVGESSSVRTRVAGHDRRPCWRRNALGDIVFAVRYLPGKRQKDRMAWEQVIRTKASFPCGDR